MQNYSCIILISLMLLLTGCRKSVVNSEEIVATGPIEKYIVAHSPRVISVKETITIQFNNTLIIPGAGSEVHGASLQPYVAGKFTWGGPFTLLFQPDDRLDYDQSYTLELNMKDVLNDSSPENEKLLLSFRTVALDLDIDIGRLSSEDGKTWSLHGNITSNDYVTEDQVHDMLSASENDLTIEWTTSNNNRDHAFSIKNITRAAKARDIKLSWKGRSIAQDFNGDYVIEIPSIDDYSLKDVYILEKGTAHIVASFSDLLDNRQNMRGMITITDQQEPKYQIVGSQLFIYPEDINVDQLNLTLSAKIKNTTGKSLGQDHTFQLNIAPKNPQVKILGNGNIVASKMEFTLPIETINLKAVDVEIFKIHSSNVLQFLQNNQLDGEWYLDQVGKIVHKEKITFNTTNKLIYNQWNKYGIAVSPDIINDPGAIYQIRIGFKPDYITFPCDQVVGYTPPSENESLMRYIYDYEGYSYTHENMPCYGAYYNSSNFAQRNILISDIATTVKVSKDFKYTFNITDIMTAKPVAEASISLYDFQKQALLENISSAQGTASIQIDEPASFAIVRHDNSFNYLHLDDNNALSVTDFDTDGHSRSGDIDGFIYTDRGVYRPGDTLFINFMIDDPKGTLPNAHPVKLTLKNTRGQIQFTEVKISSIGGIYSFQVPTQQKDLTGLWTIITQIGPNEFYKNIRIEAVKPNKLKINTITNQEIQIVDNKSEIITTQAEWLYGAPAKGLRTKVEARFIDQDMSLAKYKNFIFKDPSKSVPQDIQVLYDNTLDDNGKATYSMSLDQKAFPSKVSALLSTRVFEKGGDFSENYSRVNISPFTSYVGISIPENDWGYKSISREEPQSISIITTDSQGNKNANRKLSVGVYDINWRWWYYENERYNLYSLNSDQHTQAIYASEIRSNDKGELNYELDMSKLGYGRKMIRICDLESGHCTGDFFYLSSRNSPVAAEERNSINKVSITKDKEEYQVGDEVTLTIPSEKNSQILVSIENDNEVILQDWVAGKAGQTTYQFRLNEVMAPNVYANISLIQPTSKKNNLPLRLYGISSIKVTDQAKILHPEIEGPINISPNKKFSITVSESDKKPMSYTLAIVDEGLLDLTNFKTPAPYDHFYAKRALGIKSWDLYDDILQGYGDGFNKIISVGGDADLADGGNEKQAVRFRPVVLTAGPFTIKSGQKKTHEFTMPNYYGAVKVMVVAKENSKYGHSDKSIKVKDPLMVFPTLPRTISIGESITLPVNLIATQDNLGGVDVSIKQNEFFKKDGAITNSINFSKAGEQMVNFSLSAGEKTGIGKIEIKASNGVHSSSQQVELAVRNPMPMRTEVKEKVLDPAGIWEQTISLFGVAGSNTVTLEISQIPPINLISRMQYLMQYPYGCAEQTTSSVFPQLYLDQIVSLNETDKKRIDQNINAGINRLQKMQSPSGGISYWPGDSYINDWTSIYAGQFLIEAKNKGYVVSRAILDNWLNYEHKKANQFKLTANADIPSRKSELYTQAYRLYTLAIGGKFNLSAMNLLRLESLLPNTAKFLLASAYAKSGNQQVAYDLVKAVDTKIDNDYSRYATYGSEMRDLAILAQASLDTDRSNDGYALLQSIAKLLNSNNWYSTQSIGQALLAIGKFSSKSAKDNIKIAIKTGNQTLQNIDFNESIYLQEIKIQNNETITITNNSRTKLFAKINVEGKDPPANISTLAAKASNLSIAVNYKNLAGQIIDVNSLEQGTDFMAEITISNPKSRGTTLNQLALTQIIPSGWEIRSGRLSELDNYTIEDDYDYRDIKDDRIHTFFDIQSKKTYRILLNAAYIGEYFLPPVKVEAMYDNAIQAATKGQKVQVVATNQ